MAKYGFVYLWFDRVKKRFYVGSHWGTEGDGYICSSSWMKKAYKHRPKDFRRRILARVYTTRADLLAEEQRWLDMIKPEEIRKGSKSRYYNLNLQTAGWWIDEDRLKPISQKISDSMQARTEEEKQNWKNKVSKTKTGVPNPKQAEAMRGRKLSEEHKKKVSESLQGHGKGVARTEEEKRKISETLSGRTLSDEHRANVSRGLKGIQFKDPEGRSRKISESLTGKSLSDEHKKKLSESRKKHSGPWKGRKLSEEHRRKLSEARKGKIPWNKKIVSGIPVFSI